MNPIEFVKSIYLGDRGCKAIVIDNWKSVVKFQIDVISRIRSQSGDWEFYNSEDIEDGYIVFSSVDSMIYKSKGLLANDYIVSFDVAKLETSDLWEFSFKVNGINHDISEEIEIIIISKNIHIETSAGMSICT